MMYYINIFLITALVYIVFSIKKSALKPVKWEEPNPLPSLEGPLLPNNILSIENTYQITGKHFLAPESTAFDPETDIAYASFNDGTVRSFQGDDSEFRSQNPRLLFTGGYVLGLNENQANELYKWCLEEIRFGNIPWRASSGRKCGRPQGLRLRKDGNDKFLYIADTYHGIFKLNLLTERVIHLLNGSYPIEKIANSDRVIQYPIPFFNDLDILSNSDIVFTDSTHRYTHSGNRQEVLDGGPRGRLFLYNQTTNKLHVKLCGIHFPNGVQILHGKTDREVIVTDSARFRLLQVNLDADFLQGTSSLATPSSSSSDSSHITAFSSCGEKGSLYEMLKANKYEVTGVRVFTDSLPGFADNIRIDTQTTTTTTTTTTTSALNKSYYLVGLGTASKKPFSLLWLLYQTPVWIRDVIGKFIPMKFVEKLVPKYGLVIVINEKGKIVSSLHDVTGEGSAFVSQAERHPITGDLWLGSHSEPRLVIVPREKLPARWEE